MNTAINLTSWHQTIARIFESASDSESIYELLKGAEALVHGNSSMAILYPKNPAPRSRTTACSPTKNPAPRSTAM
ncbi:hypothetical protein [Microbulbifer taiwanensis]|uniref:hypothetical protein n=1 Tax=Microbulbifer taiwanensis TaxID=986746 RepID=UPI0036121CF3